MRDRTNEDITSKEDIMREELKRRGMKAETVERMMGPYPYGEAVVAVGKDDGANSELTNQAYVTVAQPSHETFREEVRKELDDTDVEFWPSQNADEVFETIEGTEENEGDNNEDTKSITEW